MALKRRVVTASLPLDLVLELERVGEEIERSKSWIVRRALLDWLERERYNDAS